MRKRDSKITKNRILEVAEEVFSEKGFDGARVDDIAEKAQVNKALIYYYFESKESLLDALFATTVKEILSMIQTIFEDFVIEEEEIKKLFDLFLELINKRKNVIRIIMMESLKSSTHIPHIFKITDYFIKTEIDTLNALFQKKFNKSLTIEQIQQLAITEFFTNIIPLITFLLFKNQWITYFNINESDLREKFYTAYKYTHMAFHMKELEEQGQ